MYTLRFVNNTLELVLNDSDHSDALILKQPFRPGTADSDKRNWIDSSDALAFWNDHLSTKGIYSTIDSDNLTIEVS